MMIRGARDSVAGEAVACAIAPACVGNIGVGFDLLGHTFFGPADLACVRRRSSGILVSAIHGDLPGVNQIPTDPQSNTAGRALQAMVDALDLPYGFEIELHKGIALGSGMGGSAASAVAAVVAANRLLDAPLPVVELYPFALRGESASTEVAPGDNVGPMLVGGLALATPSVLRGLDLPAALHCVVLKPDLVIETRRAREVLDAPFSLDICVKQSTNLALVLTGLSQGDFGLLQLGLEDVMVEPRRAHLIPGFSDIKAAAKAAGALGASISGSGPTLFAWFASRDAARTAEAQMREAARQHHAVVNTWVSPVAGPAARLLDLQQAQAVVSADALKVDAYRMLSTTVAAGLNV